MTWQAGGTAGDPSCENRPTGFFFSAEGRESRVGRYLGLMPGVDVRRQDKNQRKFSGERLRLASWIKEPSPRRESRDLPEHGEQINCKLAALSYCMLLWNSTFITEFCKVILHRSK